jgi:hypothetical protein
VRARLRKRFQTANSIYSVYDATKAGTANRIYSVYDATKTMEIGATKRISGENFLYSGSFLRESLSSVQELEKL